MNDYQILPVSKEEQIKEVANLAKEIWNQHFLPIIGKAQVDYMLDKFQSFSALSTQIAQGYEYFQIFCQNEFVGYTGIHEEKDSLFLSKLYLRETARGKHLSSKTFDYLVSLCRQRGLNRIWLTCNKHNEHTLAVYYHMGFIKIDSQVADIGNGYVMDDYILEYRIS